LGKAGEDQRTLSALLLHRHNIEDSHCLLPVGRVAELPGCEEEGEALSVGQDEAFLSGEYDTGYLGRLLDEES